MLKENQIVFFLQKEPQGKIGSYKLITIMLLILMNLLYLYIQEI